jgi:hypothetical protein
MVNDPDLILPLSNNVTHRHVSHQDHKAHPRHDRVLDESCNGICSSRTGQEYLKAFPEIKYSQQVCQPNSDIVLARPRRSILEAYEMMYMFFSHGCRSGIRFKIPASGYESKKRKIIFTANTTSQNWRRSSSIGKLTFIDSGACQRVKVLKSYTHQQGSPPPTNTKATHER